jgi:glucose-1-phosphate thymidylyltransferase
MNLTKGILLAGGYGSRLFPITQAISKHLLPVYNKPMIYYPLSNLIQAGITSTLIIAKDEDLKAYQKLLGNGEKFGIDIQYKVQPKPSGLPEAFILGEGFIDDDPIALNLGDHIFFGQDLDKELIKITNNFNTSTILSVRTDNPEESGVILFNDEDEPQEIIEKPKKFISDWIVCGLYFFHNSVVKVAKNLEPSLRNETEIVDLINYYLSTNSLDAIKFESNIRWIDAGTPQRLLMAGNIIKELEETSGLMIGYLEYEALKRGLISEADYFKRIDELKNSNYGGTLKNLVS